MSARNRIAIRKFDPLELSPLHDTPLEADCGAAPVRLGLLLNYPDGEVP